MRIRATVFILGITTLFVAFGLMGRANAQYEPHPDPDLPYAIDGNFDHILFVYEEFDENQAGYIEPEAGLVTTGWGEYDDIIIPDTTIDGEFGWVTDNTLDGQAFRCAVTGGRAYNNYFCSNSIGKLNGSIGDYQYEGLNWLELEMDFYIEGELDCPLNVNSDLEAFEFVWQFTQPPDSYGFGLVFAPFEGRVNYWSEEGAWRPFDPPIKDLCITGNEWHHVRFVTSMLFDRINYHYMVLDGEVISFNNKQLETFETFETWKDTFLQIGIQVDSTATNENPLVAQPAGMIVDNVKLTGLKLTFDNHIYLPIAIR